MGDQILQIKIDEGVATLTINRPKALNALNVELIHTLYAFFNAGYQEFGPLTAVVITGAGNKAFVAGADISEFKEMNATSGAEFARRGHELMFLIERFHVPVIAAVNGFALGGGCELAMACHIRVASANAKFGQPEVNLGLIPGYGGTQRLIQLIGKGRAMELMLTGDMIDADRALELGLVNVVVPEEQLSEKVSSLVKKIEGKGPLAIERVISAVNAHFEHGRDGYAMEISLFASLMDTHDFVEGTQAFLEKRKPRFTRS